VGDDVLIQFTGQDWNNPVVVGFKSDPQPCEILCDITFTINGITPTLPHSLLIIDSSDTLDPPMPLKNVDGASDATDPNIVKNVDITDFVFPIKIYITDNVDYYKPDDNGEYYFLHKIIINQYERSTFFVGKFDYNEKNPPNPEDYDYFERVTNITRSLGATYSNDQFNETTIIDSIHQLSAEFSILTIQENFDRTYVSHFSCGLVSDNFLSSDKIDRISCKILYPDLNNAYPDRYESYPYSTAVDNCQDMLGYQSSYTEQGKEFQSTSISCPFISSDENGLYAQFAEQNVIVKIYYYLYQQVILNDNGEIVEEVCNGGGSRTDADIYTYSMIPLQDKYI